MLLPSRGHRESFSTSESETAHQTPWWWSKIPSTLILSFLSYRSFAITFREAGPLAQKASVGPNFTLNTDDQTIMWLSSKQIVHHFVND